jgi:hypothetical protein
MHKHFFTFLPIFLCAASGALSAPLTLNCTNARAVYSADGLSGSCTGVPDERNPQLGPAGGNIAVSVNFTQNASTGWYSFGESSHTFAWEGLPSTPGGTTGSGGSASGNLVYRETFNTGGPVRQGFLEIQFGGTPLRSYNGKEDNRIGFTNLQGVTAYTVGECHSNTYSCFPGTSYYVPGNPAQYPIPVLLGTDMQLILQTTINDYAYRGDAISSGNGSIYYNFRLTEADGTPVSLVPTPEPATLFAAFGGLALLVLGRKFARS